MLDDPSFIRAHFRGACFLRSSPAPFSSAALDPALAQSLGASRLAATLDRDATAVTMVNSVAETDLYRKTIAANLLGATGAVHLTYAGDGLNSDGVQGHNHTFRLKFGATTLLTFVRNMLAGANRPSRIIEIWGFNINAASQVWLIHARTRIRSSPTDDPASGNDIVAFVTSAEDTTLARDIAITVQDDIANANSDEVKRFCWLEVLKSP